MRTLAEIRKDYAVLDPLSMTRKFDRYMGEVSDKFDQLTAAMREVVELLEQIERNTRPMVIPMHHSLNPPIPNFPRTTQ